MLCLGGSTQTLTGKGEPCIDRPPFYGLRAPSWRLKTSKKFPTSRRPLLGRQPLIQSFLLSFYPLNLSFQIFKLAAEFKNRPTVQRLRIFG